MNIVLLRQGNRAVLLPAGQTLIDCPPPVRFWLGTPVSESITTLTLDTPLPGIHVPSVLEEIRQRGFCALDVYGVVREFVARPPPVASNHAPESVNCNDG